MDQPLITTSVTSAHIDDSSAGLNTDKPNYEFGTAPGDMGDRSWTAEQCFIRPDNRAAPVLKRVRTSGSYDRFNERRRRGLLAVATGLKLDRRSAEAATMPQAGHPTNVEESTFN